MGVFWRSISIVQNGFNELVQTWKYIFGVKKYDLDGSNSLFYPKIEFQFHIIYFLFTVYKLINSWFSPGFLSIIVFICTIHEVDNFIPDEGMYLSCHFVDGYTSE